MNYIAHHGIKGQKWGVRRYQNEDGSYKPGAEGRYYDKSEERQAKREARKAERERKRNERIDKKITKTEDLRKVNKNIINERNNQYKKLYRGTSNEEKRVKKATAYNNADLKYTEVVNKYRLEKLKAKKDPAYKNSSSYQKARKEYGKQITDSILYGRDGKERMYADQSMGYTEKQARRREKGRQAAIAAIATGITIAVVAASAASN